MSPIVTLFLFGLIIVDKFHVIIQLATQHAVVLSFGLHKHPISSLLLPFGHAKDSKMQVLREILIYICQKILNNANDLKGEAK